jgi:ABC-2 type transport system ATP-binding protein
MAAIVVEDLGKRLGGHTVLEALSFTVARGEVFGLLGPNGAGKTTTLRILAGLYAPDTGRAAIAGETLSPARPAGAPLRRKVGLLTEQPGFYDRLPVAYNLALFGRLYGLERGEAERRTTLLLDRFDLSRKADAPFATLSRGMKQKLAIARAILHRPEVILLDEPTVGLDPEATSEVRDIIAELSAEGAAIVLCTHQLSEVERCCRRAAVLARRLVGIHDVEAEAAGQRLELRLDSSPQRALAVARGLPWVRSARWVETTLSVELAAAGLAPELVAALAGAGVRILAVLPARQALEEAYRSLLAQAREEGWVV